MTETRPRTATGYRPEWLERSRQLCLELATVIGDFMERDVTVVGGLVDVLDAIRQPHASAEGAGVRSSVTRNVRHFARIHGLELVEY